MEGAAFDIHWRARRAAGFRDPQAVAEPKRPPAAVAGFVPGTLDGGEELIRFDGDKLFALVHRFVYVAIVGVAVIQGLAGGGTMDEGRHFV